MAFSLFKRKEKILSDEEQLLEWNKNGKPAPPPHIVKQQIIQAYKQQFALNILVETGTYMGDMVAAQQNNFNEIYSIELSTKLHSKALKRFADIAHITLLQGDSGNVLNSVVPLLKGPALFWLDGHYSGGITALGNKECPVPEELEIILKQSFNHVILIDDARLFNGTHSYPTIEEIGFALQKAGKKYALHVEDDVIRLTPDSL